jgi:HAMP domain-containing protein
MSTTRAVGVAVVIGSVLGAGVALAVEFTVAARIKWMPR